MAKIRLASDDKLHRLTLADPPLNILDIEMLGDMRDALASLPPGPPILVIDAEGDKAFSAGASVQDHIGDRVKTMLELFHDCCRMLDKTELISVALVRGAALGGGCELAMGCDLVLASENAKFGQPEISLGVFPPVAAWQLSRQLPPRKGLELLLKGDSIDAKTAESFGLVNAVFPPEEFDDAANAWLARLLRHSPSSLKYTKKAFRLAQPDDFAERLANVETLYLEELMSTSDANEGLNAFIEKRKPNWSGN